MDNRLNEKLFFHNQFLFSDLRVPELEHWKVIPVGKYWLYAHPELEVSVKDEPQSKFILVGYLFDYRNPSFTNSDIVESLELNCSMPQMLSQLEYMSGIYIAIWQNEEDIFFIPDLCALREVYIHQEPGSGIVAGSTPNILRYIRKLDHVNANFYSSELFKSRFIWVGDQTSYAHVTRLKPNHFLAINNASIIRFFPNEILSETSVEDAVSEASIILPGILKAYANREQKIMVGLTGGWDSRLLLAASKEIKDGLVYFVNIYPNAPDADYRIPIRLAKKLNLTFLTVQLSTNRKGDARNTDSFIPNPVEMSTLKLREFKNLFKDYKSISGAVSEIIRNEYAEIKNVTGEKLAQLVRFPDHPFSVGYYNQWLEKNEEHFERNRYNVLDMFYWEEGVANRVGKSTTESHANLHSIFPPFNCRRLVKILLSVDAKYRDKQSNILYRKIINSLWKETLSEPVNPSFKKRTIQIMQRMGVYTLYRTIFTMGLTSVVRKISR